MQTSPRLPRLQKLGLLLIVVLGFGLRFGGLDHDLHEGLQYHPDTPKQVRAVQRFLDGDYYYHTGILDYDIYPYLHAHVLEYICRAGDAVHGGLQALTGAPVTPWRPEYFQIFWLALGWNALLATLLILVIFQLVRENWDVRAAFAAALLLAVSPLDVMACHFAGADTTVGFLATLTVFFSLRIHRLGRGRDYALAALCAACAFSTKYNAVVVLLPVLMAHGLRVGSWRALVGRESMGRLSLLAVIGILATFLTTPILLTHFTETVQNIVGFFTYITHNRFLYQGPWYGRWGAQLSWAFHHNLPLFGRLLGLLPCLAILLGLGAIFRRRPDGRILILYTLPLSYFLVGGSLRPTALPIIQTLITPLLFAMAGVMFFRLFSRPEKDRPGYAGVRYAAVALSALLLLPASFKESFLFWHQDVYRLALAWAEENVPPQFAVKTDRYSFASDKFSAVSNAVGCIQALTGVSLQPPPGQWLKTFSVETNGLPLFRNIPIEFYVKPAAWLRPDFQMPVFQRGPSRDGNHILCDNGVGFLRLENMLALTPEEKPTSRSLVRSAALPEAWLGIQNGGTLNLVDVEFAGVRRRASLNPGEVVWWRVAAPRRSWPSAAGHDWYRWSAQAFYGDARVLLATRPGDMGAFLFNAGRYGDAFPLLRVAAATTRNPTLAALALLCLPHEKPAVAAAAQADLERLAQPLQQVGDAASCRQIFGIAPAYLEALDFIRLAAADLRAGGFYAIEDLEATSRRALEKVAVPPAEAATNPPPTLVTPALQLDPGAYTVTLSVRGADKTSAPLPWRLVAEDISGNRYADTAITLPPLDDRHYIRVTTPFQLPLAAPELRLFFTPQSPAGVVLDQIEIKPDVLATIHWLQHLLQQPGVPAPVPAVPVGFQQKVDTVFQGGLRLVQLDSSGATVQRGQPLGLNFQFRFDQPGVDAANLAVFIHFIDAAGRVVFQGDYGVADLLNFYLPRFAGPVRFRKTIQLPASVPPGDYTIRVGLCRLDTTKRLGILSSPYPCSHGAVQLPATLRVTE